MTELTLRDATSDDIATILTLSHAGDSRGPDTPPLDQQASAIRAIVLRSTPCRPIPIIA